MGGYQSQFLELFRAFEKRKDIYLSLVTKYSEYKSTSKNMKIYETYKFKNSKLNSLFFFIKGFSIILHIHKKHTINIIYIPYYYYNMITPLLLRILFKIPILIKTPTDFKTHQRETFSSNFIISRMIHYGWMNFFKHFIIKRENIFIQAINKEIHRDFLDLNFKKENLTKIPNGILGDKFSGIIKHSTKETHFGYIGRLVKNKNILFLLKTFKIYLEKYPEDKLFIYGFGSEERMIIRFIKNNNLYNNIKFFGFVRSKTKIYYNIDVLIHPSFGEGISNTILEAILTDTFVIASNVPGNKEIIEHRVTGLLFNPFKNEDLLNQLLFYKRRKGEIYLIKENAKKKVLLDYEINIVSNKIINFLKSKLK